tara:strand:- start:209 stop:919 length:711 start_codon:yes stop_codon:yes gene_type:complete
MINRILKYLWGIRKAHCTNYIRTHFSQFGEDIVLKELLKPSVKDGFYIDVGCYHPKKHSNTYALHKKGWSGINIDLEEDKILLFNICRPNDHNVVCPISDIPEKVKIRRFSRFGLGSTISNDQATASEEEVYDEWETESQTLHQVINNSPYKERQVDLLTIDAEGMDYRILKSIDFSVLKPSIILIEAYSLNIEEILASETYLLLVSNGYVMRSWTFYTLFFVLPSASILKDRESN